MTLNSTNADACNLLVAELLVKVHDDARSNIFARSQSNATGHLTRSQNRCWENNLLSMELSMTGMNRVKKLLSAAYCLVLKITLICISCRASEKGLCVHLEE